MESEVKVYLEVAHVEDDDSDFFSFSSVQAAIDYIAANDITDFALSPDPALVGIPEDDFTHIN